MYSDDSLRQPVGALACKETAQDSHGIEARVYWLTEDGVAVMRMFAETIEVSLTK